MQFLPSRTHMASECSLLASSQGNGKGLINQPTCGIATVVEAQKLAEYVLNTYNYNYSTVTI